MTDDELDRALRAARPQTEADSGWAASAAGAEALADIRRSAAASRPARVRAFPLRRGKPIGLGIGFAAAIAAVVAIAVSAGPGADKQPPPVGVGQNPPPTGPGGVGALPANIELVAYTNCDAMLDGLRSHTAKHVGPYGFGYGYGGPIYYGGLAKDTVRVPVAQSAPGAAESAGGSISTPDHSTTNVQEIGVGEPDIVETDGTRVVSVSAGVLRVVDAASHKVTGSLNLNIYAGAESAQLLMSGDRVLVILGESVPYYYPGGPVIDYAYPQKVGGGSTLLLVDLSKATPQIVSTMHANGGYVDARMVGDTARIVVESTPKLTFPILPGNHTDKDRTRHNRDAIRRAPLSAWLPTYEVTSDGTTTTKTVPCERVSHPAHYTGESMLTVYSVDLAGDLADPQPISLAADGTAVYASTSSLYVASAEGSKTQLHRFDISSAGRPRYLGSGSVPGGLLDSYSMSEYAGSLRVVTTKYGHTSPIPVDAPDVGAPSIPGGGLSATAVYALDAATLKIEGHVGGLGRGEQVHAVRFLGPLAYVVTFRSVDPLYVVDLHDPEHPRTAGELKITGYSDYLHPVSDGRLLGVGENVNDSGIVTGLQVSLFDVRSPAHPTRLDRVTRKHSPSETPIDPHAFLYWPARKIAVIPIDSWNANQSGAAIVVHVGTDSLSALGTIRNPAISSTDGYDTGIERTLVIGDDLWTMSSSGLQVSDLASLSRQAWVPFS